jgi:hypothetical protein
MRTFFFLFVVRNCDETFPSKTLNNQLSSLIADSHLASSVKLILKFIAVGYYKEGFLTLQDGVSRVLTEMLSGKDTNDIEIEMRRLPYPTYADDKFLVALQGWLPLIIMLSFIYPALNIVKSIVHEKERRLKVRKIDFNE